MNPEDIIPEQSYQYGGMLSGLGQQGPPQGQPQSGMLSGLGAPSPFGVGTGQNGQPMMDWHMLDKKQAAASENSGDSGVGEFMSVAVPIAMAMLL